MKISKCPAGVDSCHCNGRFKLNDQAFLDSPLGGRIVTIFEIDHLDNNLKYGVWHPNSPGMWVKSSSLSEFPIIEEDPF